MDHLVGRQWGIFRRPGRLGRAEHADQAEEGEDGHETPLRTPVHKRLHKGVLDTAVNPKKAPPVVLDQSGGDSKVRTTGTYMEAVR